MANTIDTSIYRFSPPSGGGASDGFDPAKAQQAQMAREKFELEKQKLIWEMQHRQRAEAIAAGDRAKALQKEAEIEDTIRRMSVATERYTSAGGAFNRGPNAGLADRQDPNAPDLSYRDGSTRATAYTLSPDSGSPYPLPSDAGSPYLGGTTAVNKLAAQMGYGSPALTEMPQQPASDNRNAMAPGYTPSAATGTSPSAATGTSPSAATGTSPSEVEMPTSSRDPLAAEGTSPAQTEMPQQPAQTADEIIRNYIAEQKGTLNEGQPAPYQDTPIGTTSPNQMPTFSQAPTAPQNAMVMPDFATGLTDIPVSPTSAAPMAFEANYPAPASGRSYADLDPYGAYGFGSEAPRGNTTLADIQARSRAAQAANPSYDTPAQLPEGYVPSDEGSPYMSSAVQNAPSGTNATGTRPAPSAAAPNDATQPATNSNPATTPITVVGADGKPVETTPAAKIQAAFGLSDDQRKTVETEAAGQAVAQDKAKQDAFDQSMANNPLGGPHVERTQMGLLDMGYKMLQDPRAHIRAAGAALVKQVGEAGTASKQMIEGGNAYITNKREEFKDVTDQAGLDRAITSIQKDAASGGPNAQFAQGLLRVLPPGTQYSDELRDRLLSTRAETSAQNKAVAVQEVKNDGKANNGAGTPGMPNANTVRGQANIVKIQAAVNAKKAQLEAEPDPVKKQAIQRDVDTLDQGLAVASNAVVPSEVAQKQVKEQMSKHMQTLQKLVDMGYVVDNNDPNQTAARRTEIASLNAMSDGQLKFAQATGGETGKAAGLILEARSGKLLFSTELDRSLGLLKGNQSNQRTARNDKMVAAPDMNLQQMENAFRTSAMASGLYKQENPNDPRHVVPGSDNQEFADFSFRKPQPPGVNTKSRFLQ